ncbi:MAG: surface polysaccharide O-acyltransferase-like enzyme [Parasphingorhabdus sp.]|jgi:surface polysaccharide O-acyltransferase-like enzyme
MSLIRQHWLDNLRCLAIVLVVLIHCSDMVFRDSQLSTESWWAINLYQSLSAMAVGLFLLISGALIPSLGWQIELAGYIRARYRKLLVPCLLWSLAYASLFIAIGKRDFSFTQIILDLLRGDITSHLWFIYTICGLYLLVPLVNQVLKIENRAINTIFTIFWCLAVSTLLLGFQHTGFETSTDFLLAPYYIGYFLVGAWIARSSWVPQIGTKLVFGLLIILLITLTAWFTYVKTLTNEGWLYPYYYHYLSPNIIALSVLTFLIFKTRAKITHTRRRANQLFQKCVGALAYHSFGIYLVHVFILEVLVWFVGGPAIWNVIITPKFGAPALTIILLVASLTCCVSYNRIRNRI